jgi:GDP/UDP-N,N'-diacetylbacillosamine 2-epimerase (hydrolysing)
VKQRNICVVTGTRADYGPLRPVLRAIEDTPSLRLHVCISGMHLLRPFGMTAKIVEQDGWRNTFRVRMQTSVDSPGQQATGLGRGIQGMARAFQERDCDVAVVLGDRIEALAGAAAASLSGLAVAHIHGGEVAMGQQDDAIRHAISKLAHLHLVATDDSARRLVRMGEAPWRIQCVGAPGLDVLYRVRPGATWADFARRSGDDAETEPGPFAIVAQHPISPDANTEKRRMRQTLQAVADAGLPALIVWPNSDPGHSGIIEAIAAPPSGLVARAVRSLPHAEFLGALLSAGVIVGNSSSGIIEAPAAGTPTVNIGPRQAGRLQDRGTTFNCEYGRQAVAVAIARALRRKGRLQPYRATPYGDGEAARRIARAIARVRIDERLLRKQNSY